MGIRLSSKASLDYFPSGKSLLFFYLLVFSKIQKVNLLRRGVLVVIFLFFCNFVLLVFDYYRCAFKMQQKRKPFLCYFQMYDADSLLCFESQLLEKIKAFLQIAYSSLLFGQILKMIQMGSRSQKDINETNRMMIKEDLLQAARVPKSQQNKKNKRKSEFDDLHIFDKDFNVQSMENPTAYLPRYNQEHANQKTCVQMCLSCFGNIEICFAHLCACCGCMNFTYQLPSSSAGLVQEFGKFNRLLKPGFNLLNPCSQEVHQVDLKIRLIPTHVTSVITKDNVELKISPLIAFRVVNPVTVHYILGDTVNKAIGEAVISSFRAVVGQNLLENVLGDRLVLVRQVMERSIRIVPHGLKIEQIFIENITIPKEIQRDLSSLARERRLAQAMLIDNKADVETASLLRETAELLDTKAAMQIRYLQLIESLQYNPTVLLMDIGVDKKGFKE